MKRTKEIEGIGKVTYEENIWTGKTSISVNDTPAFKISRKLYEYHPDPLSNKTVSIYLQGNSLYGLVFNITGISYQIIEKPTWYEILFTILTIAFTIAWGSSTALVAIFPLVGGAIGGAIAGFCAILGLALSKSFRKVWQKLIVLVGFFGLSVLLGYLVALLILSAV